MNIKFRVLSIALGLLTLSPCLLHAGNEDRVGSAGAGQLLLNPWSRSSGLAGANTASVTGVESMNLNIAGLNFIDKTEFAFAHADLLGSSVGINTNTLGFAQRVGETGVLGLSMMSMSFGDIERTNENFPEGLGTTYRPNFINIAVSYAKEFSNSIYGGVTLRVISESMADMSSQGIAFDAGVRYITGERDHIKFGIALRNVGPKMTYRGDGMSFTGTVPATGGNMTVEQRSQGFEIPSLLNIGFSYDFLLSEHHTLTAAGNFTSNSFTRDQLLFGAEYGFKDLFMVRGGYMHEASAFGADRMSWYTGPTGGISFKIPAGETDITIDYSYRHTVPFSGTHTIGARVGLK